jgi:Holliday junction resolvasome RuvABC ATP-dependent DNA helicase subunit
MSLSQVIGQGEAVAHLKEFGDFYTQNGVSPEHVLITGDDGTGKMTIAGAFAAEYGLGIQPCWDLPIIGNLTAMLTNLKERQALLVPDVNSIRAPILEILQDALKSGKVVITLGPRRAGRTHTINLRPFTCIATARRRGDCSAELLSLFSLIVNLRPYTQRELIRIAHQIAFGMKVSIDDVTASLTVANCTGNPARIHSLLERLVRAVRSDVIKEEQSVRAFTAFGLTACVTKASDHRVAISDLSGIEFEKFIMEMLNRMGFRAEMTTTTGDGGIDVIAVLDKPIIGGKYMFQCKRYSSENLIGAALIRDFYGAVSADRAVKGIFITTSDFTPQAREFAERVGLELIGLDKLRALLSENGTEVME